MSYKILVVEDHPVLLASTMALFQSEGEHQVDGARDGAEALARLSKESFDLVVSDLRMPGVDGVQLIQRLPMQRHSPAVAIVSADSPQVLRGAFHAAEARGLSVLGTFPKPFSLDAAHNLMRALRRRKQPETRAAEGARENMSMMLDRGLDSGEIQAWFQPKYSLVEDRVIGVEALARWLHPELGVLLPHAFLAELDGAGLTERLLWSILGQSIAAQKRWQAAGHDISVSVNLHTRLLDDPDLPDRLCEFVWARDAKPRGICFELIENSMTSESCSYYSGASRLRMMGFGLAQDDFSSGYSSFYRLVATPFTELKLDRGIVQNAPRSEAFRKAMSSIIQLGHDLNLTVVAEGVETADEMQLLRRLGCDMVQGFLISPAVTVQGIEDLLVQTTIHQA